MRKKLFTILIALLALMPVRAQFFGVDIDKLDGLLSGLAKLPSTNGSMILSSTLKTLENDPKAYRKAVAIIERMGNPADSLHSEALYLSGLKAITSSYVLSSSELERYRYLLMSAQKNAVGTVATDIAYVTPDGASHQLCEAGKSYTLVFFYGQECDACEKAKKAIAESATLKSKVDEGLLRVVGICTEANEKQWRKSKLPEWVVNGWDKAQQIENQEAYEINSNPLFYLLSPDNFVLVKNEPSLKRIERILGVVSENKESGPKTLIELIGRM